jgi:hypothetical protein
VQRSRVIDEAVKGREEGRKAQPEQFPIAIVIDHLAPACGRNIGHAQHMLRQPLTEGVTGGFCRQDKGARSHDEELTQSLPFRPR